MTALAARVIDDYTDAVFRAMLGLAYNEEPSISSDGDAIVGEFPDALLLDPGGFDGLAEVLFAGPHARELSEVARLDPRAFGLMQVLRAGALALGPPDGCLRERTHPRGPSRAFRETLARLAANHVDDFNLWRDLIWRMAVRHSSQPFITHDSLLFAQLLLDLVRWATWTPDRLMRIPQGAKLESEGSVKGFSTGRPRAWIGHTAIEGFGGASLGLSVVGIVGQADEYVALATLEGSNSSARSVVEYTIGWTTGSVSEATPWRVLSEVEPAWRLKIPTHDILWVRARGLTME